MKHKYIYRFIMIMGLAAVLVASQFSVEVFAYAADSKCITSSKIKYNTVSNSSVDFATKTMIEKYAEGADVEKSGITSSSTTQEAYVKGFELLADVDPEYAMNNYKNGEYKYEHEHLTSDQWNELINVANHAVNGCTTDYEKIKAVYRFVAENIYYDEIYYHHEYTGTYNLASRPYDVWHTKKTICDGYESLCSMLLCIEGIPPIRMRSPNHAYNAAYDSQNKRWIAFDSTAASYNTYDKDGFHEHKDWVEDTCFDIGNRGHWEVRELEGIVSGNMYLTFDKFLDNEKLQQWYDTSNWELKISQIKEPTENLDLNDYAGLKHRGILVTEFDCSCISNTYSNCDVKLKSLKINAMIYTSVHNADLEYLEVYDDVSEILSHGFSGCTNLREVVLPFTIDTIGEYAFSGCTSLKSITIPESVDSIGEHAFPYNTVIHGTPGSAAEKYANENGNKFVIACDHSMQHTEAKAATCTESGNKEYWKCSKCGKYFLDSRGSCEIGKDDWFISESHSFGSHVSEAAGYLKDGCEYDICKLCNKHYNIKVCHGYSTNYVKSLKVKAAKKAFTVSWKKQGKKVQKKFNGYQIRYSTSSEMAGAKTVTASKSSSGRKVSKLSSKRNYYVQVRTYSVNKGTKFYSPWSESVTVKTH